VADCIPGLHEASGEAADRRRDNERFIEIVCRGETVQAEAPWISLFFTKKNKVMRNEKNRHPVTEIEAGQQRLGEEDPEEDRDYNHDRRNPDNIHIVTAERNPE
jgi:hypothetical protein